MAHIALTLLHIVRRLPCYVYLYYFIYNFKVAFWYSGVYTTSPEQEWNNYMTNKRFFITLQACASIIAAAAMLLPMTASAASYSNTYSSKVREAQTIMTKFGIPTGDIDGYYGPSTARGLC